MIRWIKSKFSDLRKKLRTELAKALSLLEDLADFADKYGPEFAALIEHLGPAIETQIQAVEALNINGSEKLNKVISWVREHQADMLPYVKELRTWISAYVSVRKALGLFR